MGLKVNWTDEAKSQFKQILDYWEDRNYTNAYSIKLLNLVEGSIIRLIDYPQIGRLTDNPRIRLKIIKDYFLYYSFNDTELTILGISDMRRDPDYIKSLLE